MLARGHTGLSFTSSAVHAQSPEFPPWFFAHFFARIAMHIEEIAQNDSSLLLSHLQGGRSAALGKRMQRWSCKVLGTRMHRGSCSVWVKGCIEGGAKCWVNGCREGGTQSWVKGCRKGGAQCWVKDEEMEVYGLG